MINEVIKIPIFNWSVVVLLGVKSDQDKSDLLKFIEGIGVKDPYLSDLLEMINSKYPDKVVINQNDREIYFVTSEISGSKFCNELGNNTYVVAKTIAEESGISDINTESYISGYLWEQLYCINTDPTILSKPHVSDVTSGEHSDKGKTDEDVQSK